MLQSRSDKVLHRATKTLCRLHSSRTHKPTPTTIPIRTPTLPSLPHNLQTQHRAIGSILQGHHHHQLHSCRTITTTTTDSSSSPPPSHRSNTSSNKNTTIALFDSLSNSYRDVPLAIVTTDSTNPNTNEPQPQTKGLAWYTCGPTVYDSAHLGHARTYVTLDILQRLLTHHHHTTTTTTTTHPPPPPIFIMNITDVDDKILQRAKETNVTPQSLARRFEAEFWEDMDALNVRRPTVVTRVTEHVEDSIVGYIGKIVEKGMAYVVRDGGGGGDGDGGGDGSVYFDVRGFEAAEGVLNRYGKLAPSAAAVSIEPTTGDDNGVFFEWNDNDTTTDEDDDDTKIRRQQQQQQKKRDPRDFVLWKGRMEGEEDMAWDSPWGPGRPGWHIECSAMIESFSKEFQSHELYVHAGGIDLKFPHHTNEIAQAEAYHSENGVQPTKEWIPHWVHTGHLHISGMKMSKSLKNFITIKSLLAGRQVSASSSIDSPADDFRLWCLGLSGSYREPTTYSDARLDEAKVTREKLLRFLIDGEDWITKSKLRNSCPPARWGDVEHHLVNSTNQYGIQCHRAIMGLASSNRDDDDNKDNISEETKNAGRFDMDGSMYLQSILSIAECGNEYITNNNPGQHPIEALKLAISELRSHLSLVGFSDRTVKAGDNSNLNGNSIAGGEGAVIDELWAFRAKLRELALSTIKDGDRVAEHELSKNILSICDNVRDDALPSIGIEMSDDTSGEAKWKFCLPRRGETKDSSPATADKTVGHTTSSNTIEDIATMFTAGKYSGMFSKFDTNGIPTHNMDGAEVSKRLRKKLMKKKSRKETK